jgi:hypothetical protein
VVIALCAAANNQQQTRKKNTMRYIRSNLKLFKFSSGARGRNLVARITAGQLDEGNMGQLAHNNTGSSSKVYSAI